MRLDNEQPSDNIQDERGRGGGIGFPGGGGFRRVNIPIGGGSGGFSMSTIIFMVIAYLALKFLFGIDLLSMFNGGGIPLPREVTEQMQLPQGNAEVDNPQADMQGGGNPSAAATDQGREFVARVLGSTDRVWTGVFSNMGREYEKPTVVLFNGFVQSACGLAQSAMGPFYCPPDHKVYIDLSFYQDMKNKLGAPGDFAQAYVIAHEIGHHVQNLFGIAGKVSAARMRVSEEEGNDLSVRMELQADCFAGLWAAQADATKNILEQGDIEEGINAASQIGDDRLQKRSQGYAVPDTFTHGSSAQRVRWFKTGLQAKDVRDCDTFGTDNL
jgi:hypothetical protein